MVVELKIVILNNSMLWLQTSGFVQDVQTDSGLNISTAPLSPSISHCSPLSLPPHPPAVYLHSSFFVPLILLFVWAIVQECSTKEMPGI